MNLSPASTGDVRAQYQIRKTLVSALARRVSTPEIVIGHVNAKMTDGRFTDLGSIEFISASMEALYEAIASRPAV